MSLINQAYYHPTLLNLRDPNNMNNGNINHGYLIEMIDYTNNVRNSPQHSDNSNCYRLWSGNQLKNLIIRGDRTNIINYKNTISLNFTVLMVLTFFTALISITLSEYFCYRYSNSRLHWITVCIVMICSSLIIIQAIVLVKRLTLIQEWEDNFENSNIGENFENSVSNDNEELLIEIPPTYQNANLYPPAYEPPLKVSLRDN